MNATSCYETSIYKPSPRITDPQFQRRASFAYRNSLDKDFGRSDELEKNCAETFDDSEIENRKRILRHPTPFSII